MQSPRLTVRSLAFAIHIRNRITGLRAAAVAYECRCISADASCETHPAAALGGLCAWGFLFFFNYCFSILAVGPKERAAILRKMLEDTRLIRDVPGFFPDRIPVFHSLCPELYQTVLL